MLGKNASLRYGGLLVAAALGLGVTACSGDESADPATSPSVDVEVSESETLEATEAAPSESTGETGDPDVVTETPAETESPEGDGVEAHSEGNGPIGLIYTGTPDGDAESVSGKLITGPGSCFSLTDDGQPELVLFEDGTEFTLDGERPSATSPSLGQAYVGEMVEFSAVPLTQSDVSGIPDRCAQGVAERVLLVAG